MSTHRIRLLSIGLGAAAVVGLLGAGPAEAKSTDVIKTGDCSARSDWKLKLGPRDGQLRAEFEVDSNRVGQSWHVTMTHNGATVANKTAVTQAPSGSFTVRVRMPDAPGADTVKATATNPSTGESCTASVSL